MLEKQEIRPEHWDKLFAPSSCLAVISTVDASNAVNAAPFGTCTRVCHDPVYIAFTVGIGKDTYRNIGECPQFVVNIPSSAVEDLTSVVAMGPAYDHAVNEIEVAGLTSQPSMVVRPPRINEFGRHFECEVAWTKEWETRLMVVGKVVAASCTKGFVDAEGFIHWEFVRPAHFCGAKYATDMHHQFVEAFHKVVVPNPSR